MPTAPTRPDGNRKYYSQEELIDKAYEFLDFVKDDEDTAIPTFIGFHKYLNVSYRYIYELGNAYSETIKQINAIFEDYCIQAGYIEKFNSTWHLGYMNNKHGWTHKQEVKQEVNQVNRVIPSDPDE